MRLLALRPKDFVSLLEDSVKRHFDESIYDKVYGGINIFSSTSILYSCRKSIKKFSDYEKAYKDGMKEGSKKSKK